jgi:hypothetical protein
MFFVASEGVGAIKAISFSLFGSNKLYTCGALENARLARVLLPDYVPIFFLGESISLHTEDALIREGALVVRKAGDEDYRATLWRFEAVFIEGLERVLFRDCDSRLSKRESQMVRAWEESGRTVHIIRDHPWHSSTILAGMFGISNPRRGLPYFKASLEKFLTMNRATFYGVDQLFLTREVYSRFRRDAMVHDSFFSYESGRLVPEASTDGSFVGETIFCDGAYSNELRHARLLHQRSWWRKLALRLHPLSIINFLKGRGFFSAAGSEPLRF